MSEMLAHIVKFIFRLFIFYVFIFWRVNFLNYVPSLFYSVILPGLNEC